MNKATITPELALAICNSFFSDWPDLLEDRESHISGGDCVEWFYGLRERIAHEAGASTDDIQDGLTLEFAAPAPAGNFPAELTIGSGHPDYVARNHAICDGAHIVAKVSGGGYPAGIGWAPHTEALAREMVRRWNLGGDAPASAIPAHAEVVESALLKELRDAAQEAESVIEQALAHQDGLTNRTPFYKAHARLEAAREAF